MFYQTSRIVANLLLLLTITIPNTVSANSKYIDYVNATFYVQLNNKLTEGENRLRIKRDGNTYSIDFILDHWMVNASQSAVFESDGCKVHPIKYKSTSKQPFKDKQNQTISFNWNTNKAKYKSDDGNKSFELNSPTYDPISLFFEARCELMKGRKEFSYNVIRKGSLKTQNFRVVGSETINTDQGEYETLIVERVRSNKKRRTRLYVAPELGYLIVRIEHQESSLLKLVATLKSLEYKFIEGSKNND